MPFHPINEIIGEIREGRMVIICDDEQRENEGDLVFPAAKVSAEKVNFMMKYGRGLICAALSEERCEEIGLRDMISPPRDLMATAFTVSVDAKFGVTTGISAHDRARTIEVLGDSKYGASDLVSPGHVFPLRAKKGGVLTRAGHTEASVDFSRMAGLSPVGVICEIVNDDGTMARLPDLLKFAGKHGLKIGTIRDLIEYRRTHDPKSIEKISEAKIPTVFGEWTVFVYRSLTDGAEHIVMVKGQVDQEPTLVRVHSECFTGDVLGSLRCDCQDQLIASMEAIEREQKGVILYLRQEGRGIGLAHKLKAYSLQDKGLDTVEANQELGFKPDLREYGIGAQILRDLGLARLRLITNNPRKMIGLSGYGLEVTQRVSIPSPVRTHNVKYLKTKKEKLGHLLDFNLWRNS